MAIYNLGSINADNVYRVPHLPGPGETLAATEVRQGLGGKGANMSVAAARAAATALGFEALRVLAPIDAPLASKAGRYRVQLLLESTERGTLHAALCTTDRLQPYSRDYYTLSRAAGKQISVSLTSLPGNAATSSKVSAKGKA